MNSLQGLGAIGWASGSSNASGYLVEYPGWPGGECLLFSRAVMGIVIGLMSLHTSERSLVIQVLFYYLERHSQGPKKNNQD